MSNSGGNKGEWSEVYAFLKLLRDGRIYAADEQLNPIPNMYLPIIKIQREENIGQVYDYQTKEAIHIYLNNIHQKTITIEQVDQAGAILYQELFNRTSKGTLSFEESGIKDFLHDLYIRKIKASSTQKTDITLQIIDIHTGFSPLVGFSIKSQLGSPSTLLNASKATNFIFKITGIDDAFMEEVNAIDGDKKIIRRFDSIYSVARSVQFIHIPNENFSNNLEMIDSRMAEILGYILIYRYRDNLKNLQPIVERLIHDNPINYRNPQIYSYKVKKLLSAVALGMLPNKTWDGIDEANGGYIIVKSDGDILAYYLHNRNAFEDYLLQSTYLETGSTTRHEFATIYKVEDEYFINMNLQIRFKA